MSEKQHAHDLLDQLAPDELSAIVRLLETIHPGEDHDTPSSAERQAVAEAEEWLKHNKPIPHEQVLEEIGLTTSDWEKMVSEPDIAGRPNG
jgi:hypothetical protein